MVALNVYTPITLPFDLEDCAYILFTVINFPGKGLHVRIDRYVTEWIELWDLEAMTSYNREIGVRGPVGASRLEFFHPGFTPTVFLHQAESVPADLI